MPELPWRGRFIHVDQAGEVEWDRCANCARPLRDPESRSIGIGPDCRREVSQQRQDDVRAAALEQDRQRWRQGLPPEADPEPPRRARREPATPEQERRWAVLQAALARRERAVIERQEHDDL